MKKKEIAIIGGGITGLTAGIYAEIAGFDACIYEKNNFIGGMCTGWKKKGYTIDNCLHWLVGTKKGTELNKIFRITGALSNNIRVINSNAMLVSEYKGKQITVWRNIDKMQEELVELSPQDTDAIMEFLNYVREFKDLEIPANKPPEFMNIFDIFRMPKGIKQKLELMNELDKMSMRELIDKFKSPNIKMMLLDMVPIESKATDCIMRYANFISGDGGIPEGGSKEMTERMLRKFELLGGKVRLSTPIKQIKVENNRASLVLKNNEIVEADYIIATCDAYHMFTELIDDSYMDETLREMYDDPDKYKLYNMFQVAYAVNSTVDEINTDINIELPKGIFDKKVGARNRICIKSFGYDPSLSPTNRTQIQVLIGLEEYSYDYWEALHKNKEEYNKVKEEIATKIMNIIEDKYPVYKGKMKILDTWTPITYNEYYNSFRGINQSFVLTRDADRKKMPSPYVKGVDNLLVAGQWIAPPGGVPTAAIQGKYAIQRILKKEKKKYML